MRADGIILVVSLIGWALGCSRGSGPSTGKGPEAMALLTVQEEWDQARFQSELSLDPSLAQACQAAQASGPDEFVTAGKLESEDGLSVQYGVFQDQDRQDMVCVRQCSEGQCTFGWGRLQDGRAVFYGADGRPIDLLPLPLPPLLRQFTSQDERQGTVLVASPLTDDGVLSADNPVDLSRRRLMILNQFGSKTGFDGAKLLEGLDTSRFDEVHLVNYAGSQDMLDSLATSYPYEVLVYIGQSVRKLLKDAKEPSDRWYQTRGYMLNAGVFGYEFLSLESMASTLVEAAPFSGPGVVLLVGAESLGDGSPATFDPKFATPYSVLSVSANVIAGFTGPARPEVLIAAARIFLDALLSGSTAKEAETKANQALEDWGEQARVAFTRHSDAQFRLPPRAPDAFGGRVPKGGSLNLYFHLRPTCGGETLLERQANAWYKEVAFQGPVFQAERSLEIGPNDFLVSSVHGVMGELREGAHFFFVFEGGLTKDFRQVRLYCNAEITRVDVQANRATVEFSGTARGPAFESADGQECVLSYTLLEPLVEGKLHSTMEIDF